MVPKPWLLLFTVVEADESSSRVVIFSFEPVGVFGFELDDLGCARLRHQRSDNDVGVDPNLCSGDPIFSHQGLQLIEGDIGGGCRRRGAAQKQYVDEEKHSGDRNHRPPRPPARILVHVPSRQVGSSAPTGPQARPGSDCRRSDIAASGCSAACTPENDACPAARLLVQETDTRPAPAVMMSTLRSR